MKTSFPSYDATIFPIFLVQSKRSLDEGCFDKEENEDGSVTFGVKDTCEFNVDDVLGEKETGKTLNDISGEYFNGKTFMVRYIGLIFERKLQLLINPITPDFEQLTSICIQVVYKLVPSVERIHLIIDPFSHQ